MHEQIDKIAYNTGMYCDGTPDSWDSEAIEKFAQQIVQLCIDEVKKTPTKSAFTSFDMAVVQSTIARSVSQLEKLLK